MPETETLNPPTIPQGAGSNLAGWSALSASLLALLAWIACCVLPLALSIAGVTVAGTAVLAGQRTWLTLMAAAIVGLGWWNEWRRRRACRADTACAAASRSSLALLVAASVAVLLSVLWQPMIEPKALMLLRSLRG